MRRRRFLYSFTRPFVREIQSGGQALAKGGTKTAAKAAAKAFLKKKLGDLATKKGAKKLLGEIDGIVDSLDNEWWEWPIEVFEFCVPGWGDAVAAGRYGAKLKAMKDRMEALERRTENYIKRVRNLRKSSKRGNKSETRVLKDLKMEKNKTRVSTAEGDAIPDGMDAKRVVEVKDAKKVSRTKQIRIETDAAKAQGKQSVLVTGEDTHVSGPAADAFDVIIRDPELGLGR